VHFATNTRGKTSFSLLVGYFPRGKVGWGEGDKSLFYEKHVKVLTNEAKG
jgi:hypothetical protein